MWEKVFSKLNILRFGIAVAAVAIILAILPRADHQSFSYALDQPWKYALLTAEFDVPILRDSASVRMMRDSIDRTFIPFVKRDENVEKDNIARFSALVSDYMSPKDRLTMTELLRNVYETGIIDPTLARDLYNNHQNFLRLMEATAEDKNSAVSIDASNLLSTREAFMLIDSVFSEKNQKKNIQLPSEVTQALNICLSPNILVDSVTDNKFRSQEYLNVTGAMGVIKTGQRIVDRGEIITPQIFTNLNT